jgi:Kdo2-lipid IVA lauroyltransferase/acyltransferase
MTPALVGRDLRNGDKWTPLQSAKNDALWALASAALATTRCLPLQALRVLGGWLGATAYVLVRPARRTALANVALVLPALDSRARRALVRRSFATLGEFLGETVAAFRGDGPPLLTVTVEAKAILDEARSKGRGVVLASAHLGPWERVAASLVAAGVPLVALVRESYDPRFSRIYERLRTAGGVRVIWRGAPGATARIVRTLRNGELLGVPMDLRARVASIDAPFLGHDAPTALGPARIALSARAPVVVATAAPAPRGGLVVSATRILADDLRPDPAGARTLTTRINDELSTRILALPHSWVWMHPRWAAPTEL